MAVVGQMHGYATVRPLAQAEYYALTVLCTVNFLNIRTPKELVVITLKFELCGSTIE